jgi:hypothetical protein
MNGIIINARGNIGRQRTVPRVGIGVIADIERRHAADEGPGRLVGSCEFADRQRLGGQLGRRAKHCGCVISRDDAGEALLYAFAAFAGRIAAKTIFVCRLRFLQPAALLKRNTDELQGFGAVLVLRICEDFLEEPDRLAEVVALEGRSPFVHRGGRHPQI